MRRPERNLWRPDRKRVETLALAGVALFAIACLRFPIEHRVWFAGEILVLSLLLALRVVWLARPASPRGDQVAAMINVAVIATPLVAGLAARLGGAAIAFEMSLLTVGAAASLAMATCAGNVASLSVVTSGFLTLFATAISDHRAAVLLAIGWMALCSWHLVANHWERLDVCRVHRVRRGTAVRPLSVALAVALVVAGGLLARGRFSDPRPLAGQWSPVSGGSSWSDPAARGGVGTGEAAIAGKDHADSFGAVDSEIFLESTESTLYDMFSDSLGEPRQKAVWERRQGMGAEEVLEAHQRKSRSERGGGSFSVQRDRPPTSTEPHDVTSPAVVQWSGPTGIRLAMQRYDTFEHGRWTQTGDHTVERLYRLPQPDQIWFLDPARVGQVTRRGAPQTGQLKVIRLDSTRIPAPAGTLGVHIQDIDRQDFFGLARDGGWVMPGRKRIPPLTVIDLARYPFSEDELIGHLHRSQPPTASLAELDAVVGPDTAALIRELVDRWTDTDHSAYQKLGSIVGRLRGEFTLDRSQGSSSDDPVANFLIRRRGGDHLFATVAALMARQIGLRSRFVTGFYVRPSAFDVAASHSEVFPQDVHAWVEIQLDDGRWFAIEPSPGYQRPDYPASPWRVALRLFWHGFPWLALGSSLSVVLWVSRAFWLDWLLHLIWWASRPLPTRRRLTLAMRLLETRARVAGFRRPRSWPQRDWLLHLTRCRGDDARIEQRIGEFCRLADRLCFAGETAAAQTAVADQAVDPIDALVAAMPLRWFKTTTLETAT